MASPSFFTTLGVEAQIGRLFLPEDARVGHDNVIVISDSFWRERFRADSRVVGSTLSLALNNEPRRTYTIIGVLPATFSPVYYSGQYRDIWAPLALDTTDPASRRGGGLAVIGRMMPGVTIGQAGEAMKAVAASMAENQPQGSKVRSVTLEPLRSNIIRGWPEMLLSLAGAVGFVLLIGCANVANLMLSRASDRDRELTVRAAIGAGRWRLMRLLLSESLLLALIGGVAGAALSIWGIRAVKAILPVETPRMELIVLDWRAVAFTFAVSAICAMLFGLVPALRASRPDLNEGLKTSGRSGTRGGALRQALVAAEIALGLVLLTGAGLMINSFIRLLNVDIGMRTNDVLALETGLPRARYASEADRLAFMDRLLEAVRSVPGVHEVGVSDFRPLGNSMNVMIEKVSVPGRPFPAVKEAIIGDYFAAMSTKVLRGRDFRPGDVPGAPLVAIVNEAAARAFFADEDPLGQRIVIARGPDTAPREIVGVVKDVRRHGPQQNARPAVYVPMAQGPVGATRADMVARTHPGVSPSNIAEPVRRAVASIDRELAVDRVVTMDEIASGYLAEPRMLTSLLGVFGLLALALTATGVYGVMAYTVRLKLHEIGVRMVLGADAGSIRRLMLARGAKLATIGIAMGAAGAWGATQVLTKYLYGVKPGDPWTFLGAAIVLAFVTLTASYMPARRASRVDPMITLRYE
jgi:putative ABC transport system permease protein